MSFALLEVGGLYRFLRFDGRNLIMPFYAVVRGRNPGIYDSWDKCRANTDGYPKAIFKSFKTQDEAIQFCEMNGVDVSNENGIRKTSPKVIEIMDSDDNTEDKEFNFLSCSAACPAITQHVSEHNTFDFASFSQRLTNLEDTYKKKMKQLEERIEALEAARLLSTSTDDDFIADFSIPTEPKLTRSVAALKRTSSKADLQDETSNKKPKTSQKISITSNNGTTYTFDTDGEGYVKVYTDGACSKNGRDNSKAGVGVWFGDKHPLNISEPVQGRGTNNMAEIQAATWAIQQGIRAGVKKICVFTDSQFVINCITMWIRKWKRNGWKTGSGDVINKEELEVLDKVVNYPGLNVKWEYVKGHSGNKGNEKADKLAKAGALRYNASDTAPNHPWQLYFET